MTGQDRILKLYTAVPELAELYKTRVRHYTVEAHTLNVLNQFERYFSTHFNEMYIETFRLLLLLHDVGKSVAYKKGNRNCQYSETIDIISKYQKGLNISDENFQLFKAILSNDSLGMYMQGKTAIDLVYNDVIQKSRQTDIDVKKIFYLLSVYYQCDVASYTEDAGGLKYLEYLFEYKDGCKIYNDDKKLLQFSARYQHIYDVLYDKITGNPTNDYNVFVKKTPQNIKLMQGNIFNSKLQVIVNTVNCVGVMGKGIALVFKLRYPKMFDIYKNYCFQNPKLINIGKLWLYKGEADAPWVLNFPTKFHWKYPSKMEYIERGLQKFVDTYKEKGITSIAFPLLGTHNGGLDKQKVLSLMHNYLGQCDIPIEIYEYDPLAPDDLFETFKKKWNIIKPTNRKTITGIRTQKQIETITEAVNSEEVKSMMALIEYDGIGLKTMEKCFKLIINLNIK
jgi:O-acetyl-ADP-ribose deacetylase (regulator of RNase III)